MSSFGVSSPGIAVDSTSHAVYVVDPSINVVDMFDLITVPDPLTGIATNIEPASVTLEGFVNTHKTSGAGYYFQYGPTESYGSETEHTAVGEGEAEHALANLSNLEPGTTYHYRLDATNTTGLVDTGEDKTFTTGILPPGATVDEISDLTGNSVVFHGEVDPGSNSESASTTYHFEYGPTESYGQTLPSIAIGTGNAPIPVEQASPANLTPGRTYHYRLVANNTGGEKTSPDHTFITPSTAPPPTARPALSVNPAAAITQTGATLSGVINPEGVPTAYTFELGAAEGAYETRVFGSLTGEPEPKAASATFTNLQPGTVYHYRLLATNAAGTTASPDETFVTGLFPQSITIPASLALIPFTAPSEPKTKVVKSKPLTRAQKLSKALKACARRPKRQRAACVRTAKRKFGPVRARKKG